MKRSFVAFSIFLLLSSAASAQQVIATPVSCVGCGGERYHYAHCDAVQKGVSQKGMPVSAPLESPQGQYLAPPANGPVFGESNSVGVEGLGLHFPPLNLQLPTLKLPSLFKVRNNARMVTNPSEAPFVEGAPTSAPIQLMMVPNSPPASSPVEPDAANSPVQQSPSQKSPVQQSYRGASFQQEPTANHAQMEEVRRLRLQLDNLQQMLVRIEAAKELHPIHATSVSSRLPATQYEYRQSFAQPANYTEPARLPFPIDGLQRLPATH